MEKIVARLGQVAQYVEKFPGGQQNYWGKYWTIGLI